MEQKFKFYWTYTKEDGTKITQRIVDPHRYDNLSEEFKKLPYKIMEDKLNEVEHWEKEYVFNAIMRLIKEDDYYDLFCTLDAHKKLVKMIKNDDPQLLQYFTDPIPEIRVDDAPVGYVLSCKLKYKDTDQLALSALYNVTKKEGFVLLF